eukprot:4850220-Karenia_brevis.AAC.1
MQGIETGGGNPFTNLRKHAPYPALWPLAWFHPYAYAGPMRILCGTYAEIRGARTGRACTLNPLRPPLARYQAKPSCHMCRRAADGKGIF